VRTAADPEAQRLDLVEDLHGHRVADPYRWLEDADDPLDVDQLAFLAAHGAGAGMSVLPPADDPISLAQPECIGKPGSWRARFYQWTSNDLLARSADTIIERP